VICKNAMASTMVLNAAVKGLKLKLTRSSMNVVTRDS
jgi:hypothetical protein